MSDTSNIDIVYLVKQDEDNEELRYSLRSLVNIPHRKVVLVGYKPSWVQNVEHISVEQSRRKYENVSSNFQALCYSDGVSDDFVLMNDDFFIMRPITALPYFRRLEPIEHYIKLFEQVDPNSHYLETMKNTRELLGEMGFSEIDSYELHVPMIINKTKYLSLRAKYPRPLPAHMRTMYGNYYHVGGERIKDVKVIRSDDFSDNPIFVSTTDDFFNGSVIGELIRSTFPVKSIYER